MSSYIPNWGDQGLTSALMNRAASSLSLCTKRRETRAGRHIPLARPVLRDPIAEVRPASTRADIPESLLTTPVGLPPAPISIPKSGSRILADARFSDRRHPGSKIERRPCYT